MEIQVYTDGACSRNPGPGGYAFVILVPNQEPIRFSGYKAKSTNNEMELYAIVRALNYLSKNVVYAKHLDKVKLFSDSAYCINPINQGWLYTWAKYNWLSKQGEEIKNKALWQCLYKLLSELNVEISFVKVKGHSGNEYNELVDRAAKNAIKRNLNTNTSIK